MDKRNIIKYLPFYDVKNSYELAIECYEESDSLFIQADYINNSVPLIARKLATNSNGQLDELIYNGIMDAYGFCLSEVGIYKKINEADYDVSDNLRKRRKYRDAIQKADRIILKIKRGIIKGIEVRVKESKKIERIEYKYIEDLTDVWKEIYDGKKIDYTQFGLSQEDINECEKKYAKVNRKILHREKIMRRYIHWPSGMQDPTLTPDKTDFAIVKTALLDYFIWWGEDGSYLKSRFYGASIHRFYRYLMDNALYKKMDGDYRTSDRERVAKFIIDLFQLPDTVKVALQYMERETKKEWLVPRFPLE